MVPVRSLLGLGAIPKHRASAVAWLKREGCTIAQLRGNGGLFDATDPACLPDPERRAWVEREVSRRGLEPGSYDEAAHQRLSDASPKMRAKAERMAQIARFIVARLGAGLTRGEVYDAVRERFGGDNTSTASLDRIRKRIEGVEPVNFAPALLDDYHVEGRPPGPTWDDAWFYGLRLIAEAAPEWPLDACYDRLEATRADMGWHLPSRAAFHRRWATLTEVEKYTLRHGEAKARKRFSQPTLRDRDDLFANDIWSLDGRVLDDWALVDDGKPCRPVELRLVDVASGMVLASRICRSENAVDTVSLILEAVRRWGLPREIYTDNGRAFAGFIVAGGSLFKFRKRSGRADHWEPPGVCHLLGINVRFAKPENGRTKIVERSFRDTSRRIDQAPELAGAHAGSRIDRKPDGQIKPAPLSLLEEVFGRELAYHNSRKRRGGFAKGRSFEDVYLDSMTGQARRLATERQLYLASLIYKPASVDRNGRVKVEGWTYGGPETQQELMKFFDVEGGKAREQILVGIDPTDQSAPAIAYNREGRLIAENIMPVIAGAYMSQEGKRNSKRYEAAARTMVRQAGELRRKADEAMVAKASAAYAKATPKPKGLPEQTVLQPRFNAPLNDHPAPEKTGATEEMWANFDRYVGMPAKASP